VLYRATGVPFSAQDRRRLVEQHVDFLYVPTVQHAAYRKALCDQLAPTFHDPGRSRQEKARLVRQSCSQMIRDVLLFPGQEVQLAMISDLSQQFAQWSAESTAEFSYLLDMSTHDYYTVTHLVNVGVAAALLIRRLHPENPVLQQQIIEGALLHDIGKRHVPERVLNKNGRPTPEEWELLRKHPDSAYQELAERAGTSPVVLEMARDHHERLDGNGYPRGFKGDQISFAARLCAVVDCYDAIAASRPYRGPTPPLKTLEVLRASSGAHLDPELLDVWAALVHELVAADPARAVPESTPVGVLSTDEFASLVPQAEVGLVSRPGLAFGDVDERRRHSRLAFSRRVRVRFVRQCKPYPVRAGEWFEVETVDLSRGGLQVRTAWPLTLNDIVELELGPTGRQALLACVVSVRRGRGDTWRAGLQFVPTSGAGSTSHN
jgi:HD-GYP domain-containing protein (c-di-GMP phosphodiesterase class II)